MNRHQMRKRTERIRRQRLRRPTIESELLDREKTILQTLDDQPRKAWFRPMHLGGRDSSWHSSTLSRMCRKGLAEWRYRSKAPWQVRGSKEYRLTIYGRQQARKLRGVA